MCCIYDDYNVQFFIEIIYIVQFFFFFFYELELVLNSFGADIVLICKNILVLDVVQCGDLRIFFSSLTLTCTSYNL